MDNYGDLLMNECPPELITVRVINDNRSLINGCNYVSCRSIEMEVFVTSAGYTFISEMYGSVGLKK